MRKICFFTLLIAVFALNVHAEEKGWRSMHFPLRLEEIEYSVDFQNHTEDKILEVKLDYALPERGWLGHQNTEQKLILINPGAHITDKYVFIPDSVDMRVDRNGGKGWTLPNIGWRLLINQRMKTENLEEVMEPPRYLEKSFKGDTATVDMKYDDSAKKGSLTVRLESEKEEL